MDAVNYNGLRLYDNELYIDEPPFSETSIKVEHDGSLPNMFVVDFEEMNITCVSKFTFERNERVQGTAEIKMKNAGARFDLNYDTKQNYVTRDYGFHIGISAFTLDWTKDNIEIYLQGGSED